MREADAEGGEGPCVPLAEAEVPAPADPCQNQAPPDVSTVGAKGFGCRFWKAVTRSSAPEACSWSQAEVNSPEPSLGVPAPNLLFVSVTCLRDAA